MTLDSSHNPPVDQHALRIKFLEDQVESLQAQLEQKTFLADRWTAFINCARIRVIGSAGLGDEECDPYGKPWGTQAHIGLEMWTHYSPGCSSSGAAEKLCRFADKALAFEAETKAKALAEIVSDEVRGLREDIRVVGGIRNFEVLARAAYEEGFSIKFEHDPAFDLPFDQVVKLSKAIHAYQCAVLGAEFPIDSIAGLSSVPEEAAPSNAALQLTVDLIDVKAGENAGDRLLLMALLDGFSVKGHGPREYRYKQGLRDSKVLLMIQGLVFAQN